MAAYQVLLLNTAIPQIQAAQSGDTYVVPRDIAINATAIISANSATDALRITQIGTGNAILVEDSANPDSTPFVVTAAGDVGIGTSSPLSKLDVRAASDVISNYQTIQAFSTDSAGINLGAGLSLGGYYFGTSAIAVFGNMVGRKENSTAANFDGYLAFGTNNTSTGVIERGRFSSDGTFRVKGVGTAGSTDAVQFSGSAPAESLILDSSGNLGIGTSSPSTKLSLGGGIGQKLSVYDLAGVRSGFGVDMGGSSYELSIFTGYNGGNGTITFGGLNTATNTYTERARITSGGDFLVGKTGSDVTVAGCEFGAYGAVLTRDGDALLVNRQGSDGTAVTLRRSNTTVGTISVTTTATAYNTSSDYRLKDNQQPLTNSGAFIDALQPKTWNWKADGMKGVGFIAHEVQSVSPGSVIGEKDAVDADGKPVMQAMEYGSAEFIANIIAELQSLRARVAQLEQGA